ncbi:hypothetical protein [Thermicanus aegyptius]|uniref:hypothetical protein n=1 Tax=Thermicanus aegyptius TaxID=94009 RepID=UPI0012EBACC1|nr:hypothetical protein [Thermicanus aegyptius]
MFASQNINCGGVSIVIIYPRMLIERPPLGLQIPLFLNTHWYILDNYYTGLNTIDGGRTVTSSSFHSYYNYDFGDTNQRTDVSHELTIYGYYTGNYDYFVDWSVSGEYSGLLDLDITTY